MNNNCFKRVRYRKKKKKVVIEPAYKHRSKISYLKTVLNINMYISNACSIAAVGAASTCNDIRKQMPLLPALGIFYYFLERHMLDLCMHYKQCKVLWKHVNNHVHLYCMYVESTTVIENEHISNTNILLNMDYMERVVNKRQNKSLC